MLSAESPGRTWEIPGYAIHEKVGEGGMGEVYRATQLSLQRTVAVKLLNPSINGQTPIAAFDRESRLMGSLAHPHVVAVHDCGQTNGRHYLVMEYVPGASLRAAMKPGKPWTIARAAPVLDAVAQALTYIHEQGVLHLDLKPENVLRTENGEVKITDFGLSLPRVDARTLSAMGLAQGTFDYCPPEQRHGLPLDRRSDVFALATLAYELLTGKLPGRVYVPATQHNPLLPAALNEVLRRGLARDPDERYAGVADFRRELGRALAQRGPRRHAMLVVLAVLFLALTAETALMLVHRGNGKAEAANPKDNATRVASPPPALPLQPNAKQTLTLTIKSTGHNRDTSLFFLNSEEDFRDAKNFAVVIPKALAKQLAEAGITDPLTYYRGKTIRVTGIVIYYQNRPEMIIDDPGQIGLESR
jgi:serine/threonine protein kinase